MLRLAVVLVGILIGAALVEGGVRLLYHTPWYDRMIEDHRIPWDERMTEEVRRHLEHEYHRNRLGLRDRHYAVEKPANHRRILVLGDSFTFGVGVADESIFPEILERRLNEERWLPGVKRIDVLNAGLPGSRTGEWRRRWTQVSEAFGPDLVLIVFFLRDGTQTSAHDSFHWPIAREIVARNRASLLYEHFYVYRRFRDYWDRAKIATWYSKSLNDSYLGNEEQTEEWRAAQKNLREIRDLARQRSATVAFVIFPMLVDLNEGYPFREICDLLERFAIDNDLPVHSLLPAFLGRHAPDLWLSPLDQHPNEKAHAIAAESLLPFAKHLLVQIEARSDPRRSAISP